MKAFIAGIVFLLLVGLGGWWYLTTQTNSVPTTQYTSASVTKVGILQAARGDDYSYVILTEGKSIGVATQQVDLSPFVGKKVTVTGQFSGTTLYADTITETQ